MYARSCVCGCPAIQFQMELTLIKHSHGAIKSLDVKIGKACRLYHQFKAVMWKSDEDIQTVSLQRRIYGDIHQNMSQCMKAKKPSGEMCGKIGLIKIC